MQMENAQHHWATQLAEMQMENRHEIADCAAPDNRRNHSNLMQMGNTRHHWATQSAEMRMENRHEIADDAAPDNRRTHSNLLQMENAQHHWATIHQTCKWEIVMKLLIVLLMTIIKYIQN